MYDHDNETAFSYDECKAAVGKTATLPLTGTITEAAMSCNGPYVKLAVDERWGFGGPMRSLGIDLDALVLEDAPNPSANPTTGELVMNPGTVLPNGAIVVAASAAKAHVWVILAMRPGYHADDAYVTWECNRPGDGTDTRWGHYYDSIADAAEDYAERCRS